MTNSEKIRQMTDEKLAEMLCKIRLCTMDTCPGYNFCTNEYKNADGLKKWLKMEAKE